MKRAAPHPTPGPLRLALGLVLVFLAGVAPASAQLSDCCVKVPEGETGLRVDVAPRPTNIDDVLEALEQVAEDGTTRGWPGRVGLIWIHISEGGGVIETRVSRSSGDEALDRQLLAAAALFRFRPAEVDEEAVRVWIELPMPVGP